VLEKSVDFRILDILGEKDKRSFSFTKNFLRFDEEASSRHFRFVTIGFIGIKL
jgi:hypothetical protein